MIALTIYREGNVLDEKILADGAHVVGRSEECDLVLDDGQISERHLELAVAGDAVKASYLGVVGGFKVGGEQVTAAELLPGQSLQMGPFELLISLPPKNAAPEPDEPAAKAAEEPTQPADEPGQSPEPEQPEENLWDAGTQVSETTAVKEPEQASGDFHDEKTRVVDAAPPGPVIKLVVVGKGEGAEFRLSEGTHLAGRGDDCAIRLEDPSVSRKHAEFTVEQGSVRVEDLGSTSGTTLNGKPVTKAELSPGDRINLGAMVLELVSDQGRFKESAAPAPPANKKAKKAARKRKEKKAPAKPKPEAGQGSGKKRLILYGAGAVALVFILAALFMGGGGEDQTVKEVAKEAVQGQKQMEDDQTKRLVIINLTKAKREIQAGNHERALRFLANVLAADPPNKEAADLKARCESALAEEKAAREKKEREHQEKLAAAMRALNEAEKALSAGDPGRVEALCLPVLALDPNQPRARFLLLKARDLRQMEDRKNLEMEQATQERLAQAEQYFQQGEKALEAKKLNQAVAAWMKVTEIDPQGQTPFAEQAKARIDKYREALEAEADQLYKKGMKELKRGRLSKATTLFEAALTAAPWHEKAAEGLAQARAKGAKLVEKLYKEGRVLFSLGEIKKACSKFRTAKRLAGPEHPLAPMLENKVADCGR